MFPSREGKLSDRREGVGARRPRFRGTARAQCRMPGLERLRSVTEEKTTRLGTGRFWVVDVEYRNQRGDIVGVESYTAFGYRRAEP